MPSFFFFHANSNQIHLLINPNSKETWPKSTEPKLMVRTQPSRYIFWTLSFTVMALSLVQSIHFPNRAHTPRFNGRIGSPFPPSSTRIRSISKDESANSLDQVVDLKSNGRAPHSSFDFLELKRELEKENEREKEDSANQTDGAGSGELERRVRSRGRQMVGRSSLLAKQVVSIKSARSLGFISQLWVDTSMVRRTYAWFTIYSVY